MYLLQFLGVIDLNSCLKKLKYVFKFQSIHFNVYLEGDKGQFCLLIKSSQPYIFITPCLLSYLNLLVWYEFHFAYDLSIYLYNLYKIIHICICILKLWINQLQYTLDAGELLCTSRCFIQNIRVNFLLNLFLLRII